MWFYAEFRHAEVIYPAQNRVTVQNGEQQIRLHPRVEVEQGTHFGEEIGFFWFTWYELLKKCLH